MPKKLAICFREAKSIIAFVALSEKGIYKYWSQVVAQGKCQSQVYAQDHNEKLYKFLQSFL